MEKRINVYMTEEMFNKIKELAAAEERTMSKWLVMLVKKELTRLEEEEI